MSDDLPPGFQLSAPAGAAAPDPGALPPGFVVAPSTSAPSPIGQEQPSALERVGHGADRSLQGIHQAFLELKNYVAPSDRNAKDLKDYTDNLNDEEALYQKGRGANAGIDWMSMAGNAGITAPLMLIPGAGAASVGGRIAAGAGLGAADAAAQPTASGAIGDRTKNTLVGALTGAIANPVAGAATDKLVSALSGIPGRISGAMANMGGENSIERVISEVPDIANLAPEARDQLIAEARTQIDKTGQLDAQGLARKANLIANGLTPTTSMVTRDPTQWTIERNLQKLAQSPDHGLSATGQALTGVYQGNDKALIAKASEIAAPYGAATQEARGMTVMSSLDDLAKASQKDVSSVYNAVREARGADLASDGRNLASTLKDLADSPAADPITQAATRRLKSLGMLDADGNLTNETMTVSQLEGLRQHINAQPNGFGKSQVIKAIDQDAIGGLGEDVFKGARAGAAERFQMLGNPATQKALNNFGELSQGKAAQGFMQSQILSAPEQDVQSLLGTLSHIPDEGARSNAMNAIRGGLMEHLQDAAIKDNGQFSGVALQKAMDKIGPNKLAMILGPDAHGKLQSLARASIDATYEPAYSAVNHSNTTPTMLSLVQKIRALPIPEGLSLPEGTEAAAARMGYSGQLANALKAKVPPPPAALSPAMQARLSRLLYAGAAPAAAAGVNQLRNPSSQ